MKLACLSVAGSLKFQTRSPKWSIHHAARCPAGTPSQSTCGFHTFILKGLRLLQLHDLRNCCVTPIFQQIFWWSIQVKHVQQISRVSELNEPSFYCFHMFIAKARGNVSRVPHAEKHRPALLPHGSACGSGKVKALRPKQVSSFTISSAMVRLLLNVGTESWRCLQASAVPKQDAAYEPERGHVNNLCEKSYLNSLVKCGLESVKCRAWSAKCRV